LQELDDRSVLDELNKSIKKQYHFGISIDMSEITLSLQARLSDPEFMHNIYLRKIKKSGAIFVTVNTPYDL
jgi:hypothetical protein